MTYFEMGLLEVSLKTLGKGSTKSESDLIVGH